MSSTHPLDCLILAYVVLQLLAVKREAAFGIIEKSPPGCHPYVVLVVRIDVAPGSVSLLELVPDLGPAGGTHQPERPFARPYTCVAAQCAGITTNLCKFFVAE